LLSFREFSGVGRGSGSGRGGWCGNVGCFDNSFVILWAVAGYVSFFATSETTSFFPIFLSIGVSEFLEGDSGGVNVHGNWGVVLGCIVLVRVGVAWYESPVFEIGVVDFADTYNFLSGCFLPFVEGFGDVFTIQDAAVNSFGESGSESSY
jgi:hypothetical protein